MEKCKCVQPGFCELFRHEMTYDPPNWQWCQNATPEEREAFKIACDKKHDKRFYSGSGGRFITLSDMVEDCRKYLVPKLYKAGITGVAAVPRSGYVVAGVCATSLNIPIYNILSDKLEIASAASAFGGYRMRKHETKNENIAVIDDTVFSGDSIRKVKSALSDGYLYCAVYVKPSSLDEVDAFGLELENPHLLDWHFFNSGHVTSCLFDLDGIFCPNVPYLNTEEEYINYISNVDPIYHRLPITYRCQGIVTARLDKYRDITERWLDKHGVKYGSLTMYPTEDAHIRDTNHIAQASRYKAEVYEKSDAIFFVESSPAEANLIRKATSKLVICPDQGKFG
jgi:orotate phosphoribosyltransferase